MASYEEGGGVNMNMPVMPAYGGFGNGMGGGFGSFGGDGWWLILLLLCFGNGNFGGGMWPMMMGGMGGEWGLYPWLNNSQHISDGFRDQQLSTQINGIQNAVTSGFGDVQTALCGGFAGVNATVNGAQNAVSQQLYTNQIADMERSYAAQTAAQQNANALQAQLAQCCCDNRAATADLKYTVATEACADRTAAASNTRDIIEAQNRGTQAILDKLCALELDGVKQNYENRINLLQNALDQERSNNQGLRFDASQIAQTSDLRAAAATIANQMMAEARACPLPSQPVYGNTPIFNCNNGCGCNGNGFAA